MLLYQEKKDCCGCEACMAVCPKNAIQMRADEYGVNYPWIDDNKCISCGLCKRVCAFQKEKELHPVKKNYAAVSRDRKMLKTSASGGVFAAFAEEVIREGGAVYGASLEREGEKFLCRHVRVVDAGELKRIQGSKYVQSSSGEAFVKVREDLEQGRLVFYSGTPCQIAALYAFLGKKYQRLVTAEIICHGVPGLPFFNAYIKEMERKKKCPIRQFSFRDKRGGWGLFYSCSCQRGGDEKKETQMLPHYTSSYYQLFLETEILRESCYRCEYASKKRAADLTMGDYWGIGEEHSEVSDYGNINIREGVSLLLVNTEKGQQFFDRHSSSLYLLESSFEKAARHNPQLYEPSRFSRTRGEVLEAYRQKGYGGVERYYLRKYRGLLLRGKLKRFLPDSILQYLKKCRCMLH